MQLSFNHVTHTYMPSTPFEQHALQDVTLSIPSGSFCAIIGPTGSGKSTLVQHVNGLLRPSSGHVQVGPFTLTAQKRKTALNELRRTVGYLFQYPEHQLFEETVEKEMIFGPLNFGVPKAEAIERAQQLLPAVGLSEELLSVSPFQLSGGQMRRVAIASILAQQPEVLILDEPAAGLDPLGRRSMLQLLYEHHQKRKQTTLLITHHMEDALQYADHIIVMNKGTIWKSGRPEDVFAEPEELMKVGLQLPETIRFMQTFMQSTGVASVPMLKTRAEVIAYLTSYLQRAEKGGV
ncbi:energy-coupling factor transporter ATPase [Alkalicoccobacillus porphyridii]|uniref:Energy-coupling factor transporter ATP-binding protein EcfA2 n=1 Tax=Alkalicoccobacillus porphyridii TaxID=2597270 RepID=A0A553ZTP9_9BACI|nr:energy-coupling factor transporter ATPase [Alkalicoccobacillus porphyridii]TSB44847.1 energy-coupling factor transporter ATPase [Alkalicoccobacillus porphyridii]